MKAVTFGEVMLRLATPGIPAAQPGAVLEMTFGGGEANVAVSLALFGEEAAFVTRLPKNDVAEACIQRLRGLGVDTAIDPARRRPRSAFTSWKAGASQRASTVTYDRAHSAISEIDPAELNWERPPAGRRLVPLHRHHARRSPTRPRRPRSKAPRAAKKLGLTVSCDLNFRKKLWTSEKAGQGHERPDGARRYLHRQRGGRGEGLRHQGRRRPR